MNPRVKFVFLLFGMILPYMALVMYFVLSARDKNTPFPNWFPYFGLSYMLFCMIATMLLRRRLFRNAAQPALKKRQSIWARLGSFWALYLVVVWSVLLVNTLREARNGEIPWGWAVLACAFLLVFIAIFSWSFYRTLKARKRNEA